MVDFLRKTPSATDYFQDYFAPNQHSKVKPWDLTAEQLAAIGLTRETWSLDVVTAGHGSLMGTPRGKATGNPIRYAEVQKLYEQRPVRVLKNVTCLMGRGTNNSGLWEGVALRDVLWLVKPTGPIRRIAFHAFDPEEATKQQWCSSFPPARVFEDPPGLAPVLLALKFNGSWLTPKQGGPVRLIAHEHYGNKNTRHLQRIEFSAQDAPTDDYSKIGQDVESPVKTVAQSFGLKRRWSASTPTVVVGRILVGMSGVGGAQYAIVPADAPIAEDDPFMEKLPWQDASLLQAPADFASKIPGGPKGVFGHDPATGTPTTWPIPGFTAFWGTVIRGLKPGHYRMYARAITRGGDAQPRPRPFANSGVSEVPSIDFRITT
ncbi:MAG: molybdopterin-dependent oxidoreductase [Thermoguttaceae bacterium]